MYRFSPFEEYADEYDKWFYKNKVTVENEIRLLKTFHKGYPSLEIGVGTGYFASALDIEIGVDPSINMVIKAFKRGVDSLVSLGENLPLRSEVFNTIYIIVTICFVEDPIKVIEEAYRVLRRNGNLIICIVPRDSKWGRLYVLLSELGHKFYRYANFYTVNEIIKMIGEAGFKISNIRSTLTYKPYEKPYYEEPTEGYDGNGFVCIEGYKKF